MFRKMRRFKQQLPEEECLKILETAPRGVLAVLGDDGYPYTVPLNFVHHEGRLYFHTAFNGHKVDAIKNYDKASFCVLNEGYQNPGEWWYYFKSVIAFGKIRILEDRDEINEKLRLLARKYMPEKEIEPDMAKNAHHAGMIELTIEHVTGKRVEEK
ncbi:MAG: pyridoxamine 5'-phosphate oxidase family protein [Eubacterium sp.]|nr:pyridoxamine 5'-phosphate oxidase family protein [Eubacterium sp.]